ncbi:MAG TPA: helix-turn-helix domain-containing protein [Gammaproteobacteria bacterium]|nr:helix-turn-helix domain-containing protein [Gammaproteobacteria bacterium]
MVDKYLGVDAAADYLGKSRRTIHRWRCDGLFPLPDGIDPYGKAAWKMSTLDDFMRAGTADGITRQRVGV